MAGLLSATVSGFTLYRAASESGVFGYAEWALALGQFVISIERGAHERHGALVDEMVTEARSLAPWDTGDLHMGIERIDEADAVLFQASGQHDGEGADYARFVEFGTAPGQRGRAQSIAARPGMFSGDGVQESEFTTTTRTRRQYRGHPGTEAQPFYFPAIRTVLDRHNLAMKDVIAGAAGDAGLDIE